MHLFIWEKLYMPLIYLIFILTTIFLGITHHILIVF